MADEALQILGGTGYMKVSCCLSTMMLVLSVFCFCVTIISFLYWLRAFLRSAQDGKVEAHQATSHANNNLYSTPQLGCVIIGVEHAK